jgi:AcrR family transcriptional regulator
VDQGTEPRGDHRTGPRKRGEVLHRAIFAATLAELAEAGYGGLTMERIAERAHTSKASLYRRWPTRAELVVAAFTDGRPKREPAPDTGNLRDDMIALLTQAAARLAGPAGQITRGMIADALRHPELLDVLRSSVLDSRRQMIVDILTRAIMRGEAAPDALRPHIAGLGPALLSHYFLVHGAPIPDHVVTEIVDEVVLPLVRRTQTSPHD